MKKKFITECAYYGLILGIILIFLELILPKIYPIIIGLIIALILNPISIFLSNKLKISRKITIFFVILTFYALILIFTYIILVNLLNDIINLTLKIPNLYAFIDFFDKHTLTFFTEKFSEFNILDTIYSQIISFLTELSFILAKIISNLAKSLPNIILDLILMILSSFVVCFEYENIQKLSKNKYFKKILTIKECILINFYYFFKSYAIILFVTFLELVIGFYFLRIENFIKLSLIIAFFDILPAIGIGLFLIPWIIFEFITGNTIKSLNLLILYTLCVIIRNIIEPKLISDKIGLSPIITIICMILGAKIFGVLGAIFAPFLVLLIQKIRDYI